MKLFHSILQLFGIEVRGSSKSPKSYSSHHKPLVIDREMANQLYRKMGSETSFELTSKTGEIYKIRRVTAAR